jgi:hypothetical protein
VGAPRPGGPVGGPLPIGADTYYVSTIGYSCAAGTPRPGGPIGGPLGAPLPVGGVLVTGDYVYSTCTDSTYATTGGPVGAPRPGGPLGGPLAPTTGACATSATT